MKPAGGLKLQLGTASRDDRRARFAAVVVETVGGSEMGGLKLVTDSRGRLRYRLPAGEYRLRSADVPDAFFRVGAHGWTAVRVPLS